MKSGAMFGNLDYYADEQYGSDRAEYGKNILQNLSLYLNERFGRGFSVTNLKQMRKFYIVYSSDQIGQKLSDQFKNLPTTDTGRRFFLSWSHYLKLMRIDDIGELKHQDIGQMQMYVNYYDRKVRLKEENETIGIVLCKDKNETIVEMTLPANNTQIFASKYQTVLPSKAELKKLLEE